MKPGQKMQSLQTSAKISAVYNLCNNFISLKHWKNVGCFLQPWVHFVEFLFLRTGYPIIISFLIFILFCLFFCDLGGQRVSCGGLQEPVPPSYEAAAAPGPASGKAKHFPSNTPKLLTESKLDIWPVAYVLFERLFLSQILT